MGKERKTKTENLLTKLYYTPKEPGSFSGVRALTKAAKKHLEEKGNKRIKIKEDRVKSFLSDQETYTLHKPARRNYPRRRVIVSGRLQQFQSDLVDMGQFADTNKGYRWILMTIDVFTKKAWAIPVKKKDAKHMLEAIKQLFTQAPKCRKLQTAVEMYFDGGGKTTQVEQF